MCYLLPLKSINGHKHNSFLIQLKAAELIKNLLYIIYNITIFKIIIHKIYIKVGDYYLFT